MLRADTPHTAAARLRLVPADQRLDPFRIWLHGDLWTRLVFAALLLAAAGAVVLWAIQQLRLARGARPPLARTLAFLSALTLAAPLFALTRAAYELTKVCIGLVNLSPPPDLVMLAPAFAEAAMAIMLGAFTAAIAATARGLLKVSAG